MVRLLMFSILLFFFSISSYGQNSIVHFKKGSVLVGEVFSKDRTGFFIRDKGIDTLWVPWSAVRRVHKSEDIILLNNAKFHYTSGIFGNGSLNFTTSEYVEASGILGKRVTKNTAAGLGASVVSLDAIVTGEFITNQFLALYGYGRLYLNKGKRRVFTDLRLGWAIGEKQPPVWRDAHDGGYHIQPGIAIMFPSNHNFRWYIGVNQFIQKTTGEVIFRDPFFQNNSLKYNVTYYRTVIKIGFEYR